MPDPSDPADRRANFDVKTEIAAYWDSRADGFDQSWGHGIDTPEQEAAWIALLRPHVPAGGRVLELGSGTGIMSALLTRMGAEVTAFDLGERMLALARAKAKRYGLGIDFRFGDAEDPLVPDSSFDLVFCRHLVWTLPAPDDAFAAWRRALRPGGRVAIVDAEWPADGVLPRLRGRLATWLDGNARRPTIDDPGSPYETIKAALPFGGRGAPAAAVVERLAAAGFSEIAVDPMADVVRAQRRAAPSAADWLRSFNLRRYLISGVKT